MHNNTRRNILVLCAAAPFSALAHHGWSSFDIDRPIYLEGKVASAKWQNPHAELVVDVSGQKLHADLGSRSVPAESATVDAKAVLSKAQLPSRKDSKWEIELAPLSRLESWKVAEIKAGAPFAVVGFTFKDEKGAAILRAEYIWVDGKTYALRSSPV